MEKKQSSIAQAFQNPRILVTLLFAFSSGLPLALSKGTLKSWMASEGVDLKTIGLFSLVGLPYTLKFLWSPLIDRYQLPFLNRRTGWIAASQIALVVSIAVLGFSEPGTAPWTCAFLALLVAFFSATQDIVIDAYRADLLGENERGPGAGVTVLGARVALLISGGVAVSLAEVWKWSSVYLLMAGIMLLGLATSVFAPAAPSASAAPKDLKEATTQPFFEFFRRPGAIALLSLVVLYKLGDALAGEMTTPFLFQVGFSKLDVGTANKTMGMAMTIIGALIGGAGVTKLGVTRSLWIFGFLQLASNLIFIPLTIYGRDYGMMILAVGVENVCGGLGTAAFTAYLMSLTNRNFSATQYALLSSVMALTPIGGGVFSGYLASWLR